jgi:hypothetical protein
MVTQSDYPTVLKDVPLTVRLDSDSLLSQRSAKSVEAFVSPMLPSENGTTQTKIWSAT